MDFIQANTSKVQLIYSSDADATTFGSTLIELDQDGPSWDKMSEGKVFNYEECPVNVEHEENPNA